METLTIHDLDEVTADRLRDQAARSGRSPEAEAREILRQVVAVEDGPLAADTPTREGLGTRIRRRFAKYGGVELEMVRDSRSRAPPDFGWADEDVE